MVRLCNSMHLCIQTFFALHNIRNCILFCFWEQSFPPWSKKGLLLLLPDSLSRAYNVSGKYWHFPGCLLLSALCPPRQLLIQAEGRTIHHLPDRREAESLSRTKNNLPFSGLTLAAGKSHFLFSIICLITPDFSSPDARKKICSALFITG